MRDFGTLSPKWDAFIKGSPQDPEIYAEGAVEGL